MKKELMRRKGGMDERERERKSERYAFSFLGMSELTGPGTTNTLNELKIGSIGKPFVGFEVKIDQQDPKTGEGEVNE